MPLVKISMQNNWSLENKKKLNELIHKTLVTSLSIPEWDYFHRVYEFSKENFIFPDIKSDKFIIIEIHLFPGRTELQKRNLYKYICDNLKEIDIEAKDIFIELVEQPNQNWGIAGEMRE